MQTTQSTTQTNIKDCSFIGIFLAPESVLLSTARLSNLHQEVLNVLDKEPNKEISLHCSQISLVNEGTENETFEEGQILFYASQFINNKGERTIIIS